MFTAKINRKDQVGGLVRVFVDFTDGVETYTEACIPQDELGFKHWVKARLTAFNSGEEIETDFIDGSTVDVSDPVVPPPTLTAAETARDAWLVKYRKWVKVKSTLIDTGILTGNEAPVLALKNSVTNDLLPAYLDVI